MRFLKRASADVEDIYRHAALQGDAHARAVVARIEEIARLVAANPGIGRVVSRRGVRAVPVVPYPYWIYYRAGRGVWILRILHDSGRLQRMQEGASSFRR
jgi:plasmid stabilization system protein ParE